MIDIINPNYCYVDIYRLKGKANHSLSGMNDWRVVLVYRLITYYEEKNQMKMMDFY